MESVKYNNSAGRLLELLKSISSGGNYNDTLRKYLISKGEVNVEGDFGLKLSCTLGLVRLHEVYSGFISDMNAAPIGDAQRNVLLSGLKSLNNIIYTSNYNSAIRSPSQAELSLLEVCATVLPQEGELGATDIDEINESVENLRKVIEKSDTPDILKKLLLEYVRLSKDSIDRYAIYGAKGLKKAIKFMLAEAAEMQMSLNEDEVEKIKSDEAWQLALSHLRLLDKIGSKVLEYHPLLDTAAQFFLK